MKKTFKYLFCIITLTIFLNIFGILFHFFNVPINGVTKFADDFFYLIFQYPIDNKVFGFDNRFFIYFLNIFIWSNLIYLIYLIPKQILKNKLKEKQRYKLLYNFVIVSTLTVLIRQIIVIFYGEELFGLISDIFSTFILFLYIIYVTLVESYIIPIFNIFHLNKKKVDFGKYHKALIILNIIFLIRAMFYSCYYLISFFNY